METKEIIRNLKLIEDGDMEISALNLKDMANDCRRAIEGLDRRYDLAVRDYVAATTVAIKEEIKLNEPEAEFDDAFYEPFIKTEKESIEHRLAWGQVKVG